MFYIYYMYICTCFIQQFGLLLKASGRVSDPVYCYGQVHIIYCFKIVTSQQPQQVPVMDIQHVRTKDEVSIMVYELTSWSMN